MCVPATSLETDRDDLTDAVLSASRVLVALAARSLAEHEGEVSIPQYRALVLLASRGPQRPADLAVALGIDPSTATRLCDRLVRKRLISRRRQGVDRREVRLDLTPKGRQLIESVTTRRRREIGQVLEQIPAGERDGLVRAFHRVRCPGRGDPRGPVAAQLGALTAWLLGMSEGPANGADEFRTRRGRRSTNREGAVPMTAAIDTLGLTKAYGATRALVDLDLQVEEGQCFGFLGPNGAGKTTTIRLLLGLQRPDRGRALVLGHDSQRDSVGIHRRIGYLPGDLALYPRMTGRDHLEWFARAREDHDLLIRPGVGRALPGHPRPPGQGAVHRKPQKIGLVLAFLHRPELLILDEPTSGLDPLMQEEFERLVRQTVDEGRTVFLSSHELDEVQRLADRVAIIKAGRVVATDTVDSLRQSAPQKVEARFPTAIDPKSSLISRVYPSRSVEGTRLALEVTGAIGPVLKVIAELDPLDVIARHADLDELFLDFYRDSPHPEPSRAS